MHGGDSLDDVVKELRLVDEEVVAGVGDGVDLPVGAVAGGGGARRERAEEALRRVRVDAQHPVVVAVDEGHRHLQLRDSVLQRLARPGKWLQDVAEGVLSAAVLRQDVVLVVAERRHLRLRQPLPHRPEAAADVAVHEAQAPGPQAARDGPRRDAAVPRRLGGAPRRARHAEGGAHRLGLPVRRHRRDARGRHEHEVLHVLRVAQRVHSSEVAPHAVRHEDHLVEPHLAAPVGEGAHEKVLRGGGVLGLEGGAAGQAGAEQVHRQHLVVRRQRADVLPEEARARAVARHAHQRRRPRRAGLPGAQRVHRVATAEGHVRRLRAAVAAHRHQLPLRGHRLLLAGLPPARVAPPPRHASRCGPARGGRRNAHRRGGACHLHARMTERAAAVGRG
mmetsp:Transcript_36091/g.91067  ORF Transcript_36091/g.91067 Transcript_36091/m.91067 type:complete len:391 (+) Transcript_36091:316-1488(+)